MHLESVRQAARVFGMLLIKSVLFSIFAMLSFSSEGRADVMTAEFVSLPTPRQETVVCIGVDGDVRFDVLVEIPNLIDSPIALSMRASDPNVSETRSEIAMFDSADGLLNNNSGVIVGYVDQHNPKTARTGERIGGTTLGQLRSVMLSLEIDFDFAAAASKKYSAQALYLKKSGEQLVQDLDCTRQR